MYSQTESSLLRRPKSILMSSVWLRPKDYSKAFSFAFDNNTGVLLIYFTYGYLPLPVYHSVERRMII